MAVQYRQAPIVGEEGCVRVDEEGYVSVPATDWLNPNGFSFLLDFQADLVQEQTVLGAAESEGSRIVLKQHVDGERNTMRLEIGHARDRRIVADFKASDAHGKRVLCTAYPARADAELFELQPWGSLEPADVVYRRRDPLGDLGPLTNSLLLSGCQVDGKREGAFTGRLANFAVFDHPLSSDRLSDYRAASVTRGSEDVPAISVGSLDSAGRDLLLDDYERLRTWAGGTMTPRDTRDASVLAYRWLCDRTPLLRRAANEFGVQVSLPDLDPMRDYTNAVREDNPVFLYHRDRWEGDWLPPSAFLNDMTFWLIGGSRSISWAGFIKFVREKLGGGHFDPDDRKRWQREFEAMIKETTLGGEQWIHVKMQVLVRALEFTFESCGLPGLLHTAR